MTGLNLISKMHYEKESIILSLQVRLLIHINIILIVFCQSLIIMVTIVFIWSQDLWDEIGESDHERDKMILQLEQECLDVYRRKVDQARKHKENLHQTLAEGEAETSNLISTLGERESFVRVGNFVITFVKYFLMTCYPVHFSDRHIL